MMDHGLPTVTGPQMAAVDKAMVEVCGLDLVQVMEVAGRAVAIVARHLWQPANAERIAVLCGSGGNGGDGLVCGRYLHGWGIPVELWLMRPPAEMRGLAGHQLEVCRRIGMTIIEPDRPPDFTDAALIVDGLFGFGLSAPPGGRAAASIVAANGANVPVLAIDIPSGVDATSGSTMEPAVVAGTTVTLGLPKWGLIRNAGPAHAGRVLVADIGIPAAAYAAVGIPQTLVFREAEFVWLDGTPWRPERP